MKISPIRHLSRPNLYKGSSRTRISWVALAWLSLLGCVLLPTYSFANEPPTDISYQLSDNLGEKNDTGDYTIRVGQTATITLFATDPEGDAITWIDANGLTEESKVRSLKWSWGSAVMRFPLQDSTDGI